MGYMQFIVQNFTSLFLEFTAEEWRKNKAGKIYKENMVKNFPKFLKKTINPQIQESPANPRHKKQEENFIKVQCNQIG